MPLHIWSKLRCRKRLCRFVAVLVSPLFEEMWFRVSAALCRSLQRRLSLRNTLVLCMISLFLGTSRGCRAVKASHWTVCDWPKAPQSPLSCRSLSQYSCSSCSFLLTAQAAPEPGFSKLALSHQLRQNIHFLYCMYYFNNIHILFCHVLVIAAFTCL